MGVGGLLPVDEARGQAGKIPGCSIKGPVNWRLESAMASY